MSEPYGEPRWLDHETQTSPDVARQLSASLARQRRAGVPFTLAWRLAVQRLRMPHDFTDRHDWLDLLADETFVAAVWQTAYERQPSGLRGDVDQLHAALEDWTQNAVTHSPIGQHGERGAHRVA